MTTERIDIVITEKGGKVVKRTLDDIAESSKKVDDELKSMNKTAALVGGLAGAALGGLAVMVFNGFSNAAKAIKETAGAAKQLGVGVENFSRLDFAAKSADLTTKDLVETMQALQRQQMAAAKPGTEMNKLFNQLGIEAVNAQGKLRDTETVLREVADLFQRMPEGTNKSALALKLFGTENQNVVKLLNEGSQGLDEMAKKSDELGYTLDETTAKGVTDFYNKMDDVKLQIEALYRQALPGLLPQLNEFANLLDSEEFKNGFNTIIQGAAQAVIWLAKFAAELANVTKFVGEEIASRVSGPEATDTVRVEQRIERLQDTMKALENAPSTFGFSVLGAKELVPSDFLKPLEEVKARIQGELDKEQNKLKLGVELNEQSVADAAERARKAAQDAAKPPAGGAPVIDWTQLGRTPKGSTDKEAKELERLQRQLNNVLSAINPVLNAQQDLARAQDVFTRAVQRGLIEQKEADRYMAMYEERLRDQLDPLGAVNRELEKQMVIASKLGDERDVEIQTMGILEELKRNSIKLDEAQTEALRQQLRVLQEIDKLNAVKEGMLRDSSARGALDFDRQIQAMRELLGSGGITSQDAFAQANSMMGGAFDNSQQAYDNQVAQREEYYRRIDELRQLDVINEQTAQQAKAQFENQLFQQRLAKYETFFGALSQLASSENRELARIGKAAAIVDATIKGVQAVQNAYAQVPYPANIAAAAAMAVVAAANVASIVSQPLPAFRTGGSMVVGGSGGTDSQTVAFRATPGERININTPAQARAAEQQGDVTVNSPISVAVVQDRASAYATMRQDPGMRQWILEVIEENNGTVARAIGVK